jgi:hypothetical protein
MTKEKNNAPIQSAPAPDKTEETTAPKPVTEPTKPAEVVAPPKTTL